jgi:hypothetical protein
MNSIFSLETLTTVTTVFSAVYGVYAVSTDFHETKNNKKVLSRAGRIGVAMLIASAALNMSADHFKKQKEANEQKESRRKEEHALALLNLNVQKAREISEELTATKVVLGQASRDIQTTARTSDNVLTKTSVLLKQTRRSLMPLSDVNLDVEIAIPLSQEDLAPYGARVRREVAPYLSRLRKGLPRIELDEELRVVPQQGEEGDWELLMSGEAPLMPIKHPPGSLPSGDPGYAEDRARLLIHGDLGISMSVYKGNKVKEVLENDPGKEQSMLEMSNSVNEAPRYAYIPKDEAMVVSYSEARAEQHVVQEG